MSRPKRAAAAKIRFDIDDDEVGEPEEKAAKVGPAKGDVLGFSLELALEDGNTLHFKDAINESGVVIFSYPRANTAGCTKQATGFTEKYDEFLAAGYKVFGVSMDNPKPQNNWKTKVGMPFNLICDKEHELLSELGFYSGGKVVRSHVVIAKGGEVLDIQTPVKPEASSADALAVAQANPGEAIEAPGPEPEEAEDEAAEAAAETDGTNGKAEDAAMEEAAPVAEPVPEVLEAPPEEAPKTADTVEAPAAAPVEEVAKEVAQEAAPAAAEVAVPAAEPTDAPAEAGAAVEKAAQQAEEAAPEVAAADVEH